MGKLDGKIAVVLGAAGEGNMGQAIARRFFLEGARVVVAGRHLEKLERLATEIEGAACVCDIRRRSDLENLSRFARDRFSSLDIARNCVVWALFKPFLEKTQEERQQIVEW